MFQGAIEQLPIGQDGLNGADNLSLVLPNQLIDALNVSFASGALTRDGGAAHLNATALTGTPLVIGGFDWFPTPATQRTIALTADGAAYKDTGGGVFGVTLASSKLWTSASIPVFAEGGKEAAANNAKLFIFTGQEQVQVLSADGATTADIAAGTRPADWAASFPVWGANHENRMWGGGNSNSPHRAYFSVSTDFEDFTAAGSGSLNVFPGEGQRLVAGCSFKGLLVLWKFPRGIYIVDTSNSDVTLWRVTRISSTIGGAGPRCFCVVEDDILFMDATGAFHLLSAVQEFGSVSSQAISRRVYFDEWMRRNVNLSRLGNVRAVYYSARREAHFAISGTGSNVNNRRVIWDFNADIPRARYNDFPVTEELFMRLDIETIARPAAGDNAGFIWLLDQVNRNSNNASYTSAWQSAHMDLTERQLSHRRKNGKFLELVITPLGNWNMNVGIYWDGVLAETIDFNQSSAGAILAAAIGDVNAFVLDSSLLSGGTIQNKKRRITGSGKRISIRGTLSDINEDFAISKFMLYYTAGSDLEDAS